MRFINLSIIFAQQNLYNFVKKDQHINIIFQQIDKQNLSEFIR